MDIWLPWLVVVISSIFHLLSTLVLIAFPSRNITYLSSSMESPNGNGDHDQIRQLDNRARVVFIGLQAASLVAGALAISELFGPETGSGVALALGGLIAFAARFAIQGTSSFIAHRYRDQTRRSTIDIVVEVLSADWSIVRDERPHVEGAVGRIIFRCSQLGVEDRAVKD